MIRENKRGSAVFGTLEVQHICFVFRFMDASNLLHTDGSWIIMDAGIYEVR